MTDENACVMEALHGRDIGDGEIPIVEGWRNAIDAALAEGDKRERPKDTP